MDKKDKQANGGIVRRKREFVRRVREMQEPAIEEFDPGDTYDLIKTQWQITDKAPVNGARNWFYTPTVRLSRQECYGARDLASYYARVEKARAKYNRWFDEALSK